MSGIESTEYLCNAILALTHPALFDAGVHAMQQLELNVDIEHVQTHHHTALWPSVFSGIGVISNRVTPRHRDDNAWYTWYDLLASLGTHQEAQINIEELGASFSYRPGTVFLVCGKLLGHSVDKWEGGEQICMAHYMRDMLHERLQVHRPHWCRFPIYTRLFDNAFKCRHGYK